MYYCIIVCIIIICITFIQEWSSASVVVILLLTSIVNSLDIRSMARRKREREHYHHMSFPHTIIRHFFPIFFRKRVSSLTYLILKSILLNFIRKWWITTQPNKQ